MYYDVYNVEVKQYHYRPGQALRIPENLGSQISRKTLYDVGKVVSPMHRPHLPNEIFLLLVSVRGCVNLRTIVRPVGISK